MLQLQQRKILALGQDLVKSLRSYHNYPKTQDSFTSLRSYYSIQTVQKTISHYNCICYDNQYIQPRPFSRAALFDDRLAAI